MKKILLFLVCGLLLAHPALADAVGDGIKAYEKKDYPRALQLLQPAAQGGDARAQLYLGYMNYHGVGVKEDDAQALAWFLKAAGQGNAEAQFQAAQMYTFGFGTANDLDADAKAAQLYFDSASQGHADAQYHLGLMFLAGKGVYENRDEAIKWIRKAANQGNAGARDFLGGYDKKK